MQSYQRFQCIGHTDFNTSGANGPCSLSRVKVGTHSAFRAGSHTAAHTPKQGPSGWGRYYYPRTVSHVSETLRGRVSERQTLPLSGLGRGRSRKTQRAFGTAMHSCASLFRRRRGPAGLRDLFATCGDVAVLSLCAQYFLNVRGVGGITTLGALCVFSKRWTTACQSGYPLLVRLHPSVIRAICNLHNVANITL